MGERVTCPRCEGRRTVPIPRTFVWEPGQYVAPPFCPLCCGHGWVSWVEEPQGMAIPVIVVCP